MNNPVDRSSSFKCAAYTVGIGLVLVCAYLMRSSPPQQSFAADDNPANALESPKLVAAGTAEYVRPRWQDNKKTVRVKLPADIATRLSDDYIVLLTNRFPTGGYPFFSAYWKPAEGGFDISLVDVSIADGTSTNYDNPNTKYLIDWLVVKK